MQYKEILEGYQEYEFRQGEQSGDCEIPFCEPVGDNEVPF